VFKRGFFFKRRFCRVQTRFSFFADVELKIVFDCKQMTAEKIISQKFFYFLDAFREIEILRRVARILPEKKKQTLAFFRLNQANQQFLQMRVVSAIIAQSHFDKLVFAQTSGEFADEFFGIFAHIKKLKPSRFTLPQMNADKNSIKTEYFKENVLGLLTETFEGSPPEGSRYLDRAVGVLNTIEKISANDASRSIGGATFAAHLEHTRHYLVALVEFINGRTETVDWDESWLVKTVDEAAWNYPNFQINRTLGRR
jgi:hypothetical protein